MSKLAGAATYYFCIFGALGALLPFYPVVLEARGFTVQEVGWVLVVMPIGDVTVPTIWGFVADRWELRRWLLVAAAVGSGVTILLLARDVPLIATMLYLGIFCLFRAAVVPLGDANTRALLTDEGANNYGLVRVWGSVGFAGAALLTGWLKADSTAVFATASSLYLVAALVAFTLPKTTPSPRKQLGSAALREVLRPAFVVFVIATMLHYSGHAMYDAFISLHLLKIGFSERLVGIAWALGVGGEIVLLFFTPALLRRYRARDMLRICAAAAATRWIILATVTTPWVLLSLQPLHALTFGLWYVCGVAFVQERAPEDLRTTLQAFMIAGIGSGRVIGYLVGGSLYDGDFLFGAAAIAAGLGLVAYSLLASKRLSG